MIPGFKVSGRAAGLYVKRMASSCLNPYEPPKPFKLWSVVRACSSGPASDRYRIRRILNNYQYYALSFLIIFSVKYTPNPVLTLKALILSGP